MTGQNLMRFAMVLQNQAASTIEKYVCKLTECILFEYPFGLTSFGLSELIKNQFGLEFSDSEIEMAIAKKGAPNISKLGGVYVLRDSKRGSLESEMSLSEKLDELVEQYITQTESKYTSENLTELLYKYLYYAFNSNVKNLVYLFQGDTSELEVVHFDGTNEEISAINEFLRWDNPEKNKLIYCIISTCYEYCMLTTKKDRMLSKELFKGKRLYLDANIIFRLMGIHNQDRKTVTQKFVDQCNNVGIELYYTSQTMDEVLRVISSQTDYIKSIAGYTMPVNYELLDQLNPNVEVNDFYKFYYNWCQEPNNRYGDYSSFNRYLTELATGIIKKLKYKGSMARKTGKKAEEFLEQANQLRTYKNFNKKHNKTSKQSAETDISNILDILEWRSGTGANIWQTNDFMVSADQYLIDWTNDVYPGVPIVVLPSVWLSIILRYSGRTDDDYKAFCLFLTQRHHVENEQFIDPILLLRSINLQTDDIEIKGRIITEIIQNKNQYSFKVENDYSTTTEKVFDKVLKEQFQVSQEEIAQIKEESQKQISRINETYAAQVDELYSKKIEEEEKTLRTLALNEANKKTGKFKTAAQYKWVMYTVAAVLYVGMLFVIVFEKQPIYALFLSLWPQDVLVKITGNMEFYWTLFMGAVTVISMAVGMLVDFMGGEYRQEKLINEYYNQFKEALNNK